MFFGGYILKPIEDIIFKVKQKMSCKQLLSQIVDFHSETCEEMQLMFLKIKVNWMEICCF